MASGPVDMFAPRARSLIGVIHLAPTRGPNAPDLGTLLARVAADARAYHDAGFNGIIVENHGDAPFVKQANPPETIATLARAAHHARETTGLPVGVNVLRNDGPGAYAVAHAASAAFVRVNVLTGAMVTDQGIIEGCARAIADTRASLPPRADAERIRIMADVDVKHAAPLVTRPIDVVVEETIHRGGADGILVTGPGTGRAVDPERLRAVCDVARQVPVWAASGATADNIATLLDIADGAIVGTAVKEGGATNGPVAPDRARAFVDAARS